MTTRIPPADRVAPAADDGVEDADDTLILLFMCCHPSLTGASQIALTLRALGGLTTAEVARALLVPEDTVTRRITRAKQAIRESGLPFRMPSTAERAERLAVVLHVLYLIFNEGYVSTSGASLQRPDLAAEAIRLARLVYRLLPNVPEVAGLLALMLLTDARRAARTGAHGELVPMAEQDRSTWDRGEISEGLELVSGAFDQGVAGPYLLQAAIAALHDESPTIKATDWVRIEGLYEQLATISDNPVIALNHAVAVAMVRALPRASSCSRRSRGIGGLPKTIGSTRYGGTCSRCSVAAMRRGRPMRLPRLTRAISRSAGIFGREPSGSRRIRISRPPTSTRRFATG